MSTINAPWTVEQVEALNRHQVDGVMHPYTCPNRGDGHHPDRPNLDKGTLVAATDGWVCADCGYRQTWAHDFSLGKVEIPPLTLQEHVNELLGLTECHCNEAWTGRGMHDPQCREEYREDVEALIDEINRLNGFTPEDERRCRERKTGTSA